MRKARNRPGIRNVTAYDKTVIALQLDLVCDGLQRCNFNLCVRLFGAGASWAGMKSVQSLALRVGVDLGQTFSYTRRNVHHQMRTAQL
jgi:hypothetical protein